MLTFSATDISVGLRERESQHIPHIPRAYESEKSEIGHALLKKREIKLSLALTFSLTMGVGVKRGCVLWLRRRPVFLYRMDHPVRTLRFIHSFIRLVLISLFCVRPPPGSECVFK